jgi:uncharacterized lipoprotein
VAASLVVAVLAACDSDELVPDVTTGDEDRRPPATDTRTSDPPISTLPVTAEP